jgi:hypothetical protein
MTVHQLRKRCFILDPSPWDDDAGVPHYATRYRARKDLAECLAECDDDDAEKRGRLAKVRAKHLPAPCWIAYCDGPGCNDTLGDEEEGPSCIHFATADQVIAWMPGEGWTRTGADGALCHLDSDGEPEPIPPSPAEQEAAGQLSLLADRQDSR